MIRQNNGSRKMVMNWKQTFNSQRTVIQIVASQQKTTHTKQNKFVLNDTNLSNARNTLLTKRMNGQNTSLK